MYEQPSLFEVVTGGLTPSTKGTLELPIGYPHRP